MDNNRSDKVDNNRSDKNKLIRPIIIIMVITFIVYGIYIYINMPSNAVHKEFFPEILGNMVLRNNETGINFVKSMTSYDDFRGFYTQGYKATYSGRNGTMIIFAAQMHDNISADGALNDMAVRMGYNPNRNSNLSFENNTTIIKLPVTTPTVYVIQKDKKSVWHYAFTKTDKVYWIGFNNSDIEYQINILREAYMKIDD